MDYTNLYIILSGFSKAKCSPLIIIAKELQSLSKFCGKILDSLLPRSKKLEFKQQLSV